MANRAFLDSLMLHFPEKVDVIQLHHSDIDIDRPHYYFVPPLSRSKQLSFALQGHFHRLYKWLPAFLRRHGSEYSHCVMNQSYYGDLLPCIISHGIKVAVIHHNYEVRHQMDNKLPATLYGLTSFFVKRNERMALSQASLNMYLTKTDYLTFLEAYPQAQNANHAVVGIYETAATVHDTTSLDSLPKNVIVICGSLDNKQTELAVKDVFDNYYDIISSVYDNDFQLIIAGRNPGEYIRAMASTHPQVTLIQNPDNMNEVLNKAGIFLCPVNCGSGLKLRILDGLRSGLPILTHKVSVPGYEAFTSKPWFCVYDDKKTFREGLLQIIKVLHGQPLLSTEISGCYHQHFSFEDGDKRFMQALTPFLED